MSRTTEKKTTEVHVSKCDVCGAIEPSPLDAALQRVPNGWMAITGAQLGTSKDVCGECILRFVRAGLGL